MKRLAVFADDQLVGHLQENQQYELRRSKNQIDNSVDLVKSRFES
jgi:hypothetical protein